MRFSKGVVEIYMVALVLGTIVVGGAGYWMYSSSGRGIGTTTETLCVSDRNMYCNYLLYGGTPPTWKERCGDPPTLEECEAPLSGEPIKCTPGDTRECTVKCKGCVGNVCDPEGKSVTGEQTCQADETWGTCDAVCIDDCENNEDCGALECGDGELDSGEECELPDTVDNTYCAQEAECDYDNRKYGVPPDEYGNCNSNCQCVLDALSWGEADDENYCTNCGEHCGDGKCQTDYPCEEDGDNCPEDCCTSGDIRECVEKCKGCVGNVCDPEGKSVIGNQTCEAGLWKECDAVCENDCEDNDDCVPEPLNTSIISPPSGEIFRLGDNILFDCSVSGGTPPYTYLWQRRHSRKGLVNIGNTKSLIPSYFPSQRYSDIFLTVTDNIGVTVYVPYDPKKGNGTDHRIELVSSIHADIYAPKDGDVFEELDEINFEGLRWGGKDPYVTKWTSSINGEIATYTMQFQLQFKTRELFAGIHTITLSANDGFGDTATDSITITVNSPPSIKILIMSPKEGHLGEIIFQYGDEITFDSLVAGGVPPYDYTWASSIDGIIGYSQTFNKNDLSDGDHIITLTVIDDLGAFNSENILVHIPLHYFDWRDYNGENWITSVKSQGSCGSCWAFATLGVVEAKYNIQEDDPTLDIDLSEQYLVSDCAPWAGMCLGGTDGAAFEYVAEDGVPDENCCGYIAKNWHLDPNYPCPPTCDDGSPFEFWKIDFKSRYENRVIGNRAELQYILTQKGPLYIAIDASDLTDSGRKDKDSCRIYECGADMQADHAIVLVGYDNIDNYWIIKNSWGVNPIRINPCGIPGDGFQSIDYDTCDVEKVYYVEEVLPP